MRHIAKKEIIALYEKYQVIIENMIVLLGITVMSFLTAMQTSNNLFSVGESGTDSSVFKYIGWLVTEGHMPYKDSFDHKGPLLYLVNALGIRISYWRGIWVVEFVTILFTFFLLYKIARLYLSRFMSLLTLCIVTSTLFNYFEGGNLTEEYAMPFIACGIYLFTSYFISEKISNLGLILCGLSFGAVCMLRPNMATVWIVMCVAVFFKCICEKKANDLLRFVRWFLIGVLIIVLPISIWLCVNGALGDCIQNYIVFNKMYTSDSTRASMSACFNSFIFFLNNTMVLVVICIAIYNFSIKKSYYNAMYIVYLVMSFVLISLSGQTYKHYGMVLIPAMIYPIAYFLNICMKEKKHVTMEWFSLFLFMSLLVLPEWLNAATSTVSQYFTRDEVKISDSVMKITSYIEQNTEEDEEIIVCGNWNVIYDLSKRKASSVYSYQNPIALVDSKIKEKFWEDLETNEPKVLVTGSSVDPFYDETRDYVLRHAYEFVDIGVTDYEIYKLAK